MNEILLYAASVILAIWGASHIMATGGVVRGFGDISPDNRNIITMEWIIEGVALISTAAFVAITTAVQPEGMLAAAVYAVAVASLIVLALVALFTGFRVAFLPFRLCPFVLTTSALLIAAGAWL